MKKLPEWFNVLNSNSYISLKELQEVLGYKSMAALNKAIQNGDIPPPDEQPRQSFHVTSTSKPRYKVSTVITILNNTQTEEI